MAPYTGGPAFPTTKYYDEKPVDEHEGMSLRDYFAGQVISAVYAASIARGAELQAPIAEEAYELADAMLEARTHRA